MKETLKEEEKKGKEDNKNIRRCEVSSEWEENVDMIFDGQLK